MSRKMFTRRFSFERGAPPSFLPKAPKSRLKYVLTQKELFIRRSKSCNFAQCCKTRVIFKPDVSKSVAGTRDCVSHQPLFYQLNKFDRFYVTRVVDACHIERFTIHRYRDNLRNKNYINSCMKNPSIENQIVSIIGTVRELEMHQFSLSMAGKNS